MKFLAMLTDSLREAIDTFVFYVMVGLSLLVTLVTLSLTFTPDKGLDYMKFSAAPLMVDMKELNPEELERMGSRTPKLLDASRVYEVVGADPLDGAAEGPTSSYRVTVRALFTDEKKAEEVRAKPDESLAFIKDRYGRIGELRLVDVAEVRLAGPDNPHRDVKTDFDEGKRPGGGGPFGLRRRPREAKPDQPPEEREKDEAKQKEDDRKFEEQWQKEAPKRVFFEVTAKPTSATVRLWPHKVALFFGALPLGSIAIPLGLQLVVVMQFVVNGIGAWVAILVSVVITAFFIPNMLRKGTIDLLLVKPIMRPVLLIYKYMGGLLFILLNTSLAVVGVWLALGLRSGLWANYFLLTIFVVTFFFAILYSVSTLFAVLTRSPIVAILLTCAVWFGLFVVGLMYNIFEAQAREEEKNDVAMEQRWSNNSFATAVRAVHFVTPRTSDVNEVLSQMMVADLLTGNQVNIAKLNPKPIPWVESLTVSFTFIAVMLGLSCLWFATRDY